MLACSAVARGHGPARSTRSPHAMTRPSFTLTAARRAYALVLLAGVCGLLAAASGCGRNGPPVLVGSRSSGSHGAAAKLSVVAAENFWASIAAQLGGGRASVSS